MLTELMIPSLLRFSNNKDGNQILLRLMSGLSRFRLGNDRQKSKVNCKGKVSPGQGDLLGLPALAFREIYIDGS
jgi:hypothetical protein